MPIILICYNQTTVKSLLITDQVLSNNTLAILVL